MQILSPHINNHGKCKSKTNAKQKRLLQEHEQWLKSNGLHTSQLKVNKKQKLQKLFDKPVEKMSNGNFDNIQYTGAKKEEKVYTGDNLIGIAVVHKSGLQPVFNKKYAEDLANMRR
jgi:hypothetical protein